jgi:hypothetical protein
MIFKLPIEIRDVPPGSDFTRLAPGEIHGLPDGVHTGGAWLSPDGKEVWKPLDGRPSQGADFHLPTMEAECLEAMAGNPAFPRNWRMEEAGELTVDGTIYTRRWLVRDKAILVPDDFPAYKMDLDDVYEIERGMRAADRAKWSIGDHLSVAYDRQGRVFILDLSCAHGVESTNPLLDNEPRFRKWARAMGFERLVALREYADAVTSDLSIIDEHGEQYWYAHVYASRCRPISGLWADIEDAVYVQPAGEVFDQTGVWTWVIVPEPLSEEVMRRYELTWGWSPIGGG